LENFYGNHRNFVKSRNFKQLRGNVLGVEDITTCDPVKKMSDLGDEIPKVSIGNVPMKNEDVAFPCGLIAKYMFDDTYTLYDNNNAKITIDETNIAHDVDKKYKFKNPDNADRIVWKDVEDGKLIKTYC
jgi:hypothetical protein